MGSTRMCKPGLPAGASHSFPPRPVAGVLGASVTTGGHCTGFSCCIRFWRPGVRPCPWHGVCAERPGPLLPALEAQGTGAGAGGVAGCPGGQAPMVASGSRHWGPCCGNCLPGATEQFAPRLEALQARPQEIGNLFFEALQNYAVLRHGSRKRKGNWVKVVSGQLCLLKEGKLALLVWGWGHSGLCLPSAALSALGLLGGLASHNCSVFAAVPGTP